MHWKWPLIAAALTAILFPAAADPFDERVLPLVTKYCVDCHNPTKTKGDLDLSRFKSLDMVVESTAVWHRMAKRVMSKEMPPKSAPQPTEEERAFLIEWSNAVENKNADCDQIASEASQSWYPGYVMSRRLNRYEYENTIRDLIGIKMDLVDVFPADGAGGEGFDNNGNALFLSAIQMEKYVATAQRVIDAAMAEGNDGADARKGRAVRPDSEAMTANRGRSARERLITSRPGRGVSKRQAAERVCLSFTERAWRRPVTAEEMSGLLALFDKAIARGDHYDVAIQLPLKAALVSPNFLFLAEPEPGAVPREVDMENPLAQNPAALKVAQIIHDALPPAEPPTGEYALNDYPLASRLSYFLWASMPDEELFELARQGQLQDPEVVKAQVRRMLLDPKAKALGELFAMQWLGITQLGEVTKPDANRYPEFDAGLAQSMRMEPAMLFNSIVAENRPLIELVNAPYSFVNEELAEIYGIEGVRGTGLQRVQLADARRGGVLGMAGVLTATSHPLRTSPVLRGKWVLEQLLGEHVPAPPPNVPQLPEDEQHLEGLTLRERMEAHRKNPDCASCHQTMDPIGFGLENFDPIGRWRTEQGGKPIDSAGALPSGQAFNGPEDLKKILEARKDDFSRNLSRKLLGYALGRSLTKFDECVVDKCVAMLQHNEYRPVALFTTIATSHPFRYRFAGSMN